MKKYSKWVGLLLVVLCATILPFVRKDVKAANDELTPEYKKDIAYYNVSSKLETNANGEDNILITADHGIFSVEITGTLNGTYTLTGGTPLVIPYDKTQVLSANGTITLVTPDPNYKAKYKGTLKLEISFETGEANEKVPNEAYNGLCATFRNETSAQGSEAVAFMQKAMSYCYEQTVTANYSEKNIKTMINNANQAWKITQLAKNTPQGDLTPTEGFTPVDSTNIKSTLKCDPWSKEKNVEKYVYTKLNAVKNDVCHTDCKEELTVIYDPPVSVKAGLCFTYTVEIKSKVTCATKVEANPPTMPQTCEPYPICYHHGYLLAGYEDQGGPNEDFDQCVKECDGGKYTQKCINKCYKKVYGKTTTKGMLSYTADEKAEKTTGNGARCNSSNAYAIYLDVQNNSEGSYQRDSSGRIYWSRGANECDTSWTRAGRYYFKDTAKAARTVRDVVSHDPRTGYHYYIRSDGIKTRRGCSDNCYWTGCPANAALNPEEAMKKYQAALEEYNKKIEECNSYAACEEKTSYFTMSVLPSNGDDWVEYEATNSPQKNNTQKPEGDTIVNDHSGVCYGKTDAEGNDYRTVINFPGVWTNNKNGQVVTERPPKDEEVFYKHKPNQYCTPLNSMNVNEKWWVWDQGVKEYTAAEKASIAKNIKYNIKASVKNFGRFSWDLNINCFYGIYNGTFDDDEPVKTDCDINDKDCVTTDITNYRYKAASLDDLFAGEKETTNAQETGRETGWNWSCAATDLTDKNYPVAPTALITDIQEKGDSIYQDDSKYLDYSITLTPATISKIKSTNKAQKNFLNYTGTRDKKKDTTKERSTYRSSLLDELGSDVVTTRYTSAIGCNNQEGGKCVTSSTITKDQCITTYESLMK